MTAQAHELLILDGVATSMLSCPSIPEHHDRIEPVPMEEVAAAIRGGVIRSPVLSTACWRQYIAAWEVRDRRLYLLSIEGIYRVTGEGPVPADWFTGLLRVPLGNLINYVHMGFESVYERELHIDIEKGRETGRREMDTGAGPAEPFPLPGNQYNNH